MRIRLLSTISLFAILAAFPSPAGQKTRTVIREGISAYEIPSPVFKGKPLAVTSESAGEIRFASPYGSRNSFCHAAIGGDRLSQQSRPRRVRDYGEFCAFKMVLGARSGGGVGTKAFEVVDKVREDATSFVFSTRWREKGDVFYGAMAITLAHDLPVGLTVVIRERSDSARQREVERALVEWCDAVVAANKRLPRYVTVERGFLRLDVPLPVRHERYMPGENETGVFCSFDAPREFSRDAGVTYLGLPVFGELSDTVTGQDAFRRLADQFVESLAPTVNSAEILARGKKHFLVSIKEPGRPAFYVDFLFVKSRILPLGLYPGRDFSGNPETVLDAWRRDVFRENHDLED